MSWLLARRPLYTSYASELFRPEVKGKVEGDHKFSDKDSHAFRADVNVTGLLKSRAALVVLLSVASQSVSVRCKKLLIVPRLYTY